jgi:hypothetical protein
LFHLIYLSNNMSLETREKQFLKVSTIAQMLKGSRLKGQFSLFKHIRLRCLRDRQTPVEKRRACKHVAPSLSQSSASRSEKKSRLLISMWFQRLWENSYPKCNEGLILWWLSIEMIHTELWQANQKKNLIFFGSWSFHIKDQ